MPGPNFQPLAVITPQTASIVVALLQALRDGTGATTLFTSPATGSGSVIGRIKVTHQGAIGAASTAMVCRLYLTSGGVTTMIDEIALPSATPTAAGVLGASAYFTRTNIVLKAGDVLKVSQSVSESVGYSADQAGDY